MSFLFTYDINSFSHEAAHIVNLRVIHFATFLNPEQSFSLNNGLPFQCQTIISYMP